MWNTYVCLHLIRHLANDIILHLRETEHKRCLQYCGWCTRLLPGLNFVLISHIAVLGPLACYLGFHFAWCFFDPHFRNVFHFSCCFICWKNFSYICLQLCSFLQKLALTAATHHPCMHAINQKNVERLLSALRHTCKELIWGGIHSAV